jgi:hypothetical protein
VKLAGAVLLAVMAIHVAVRPEAGWILLSTCDVACATTALGLIAGWPRAVAVAFLFEVMIGLPAFALGVLTTYDLNPTGVIIHLAPPLIGGVVVARHGLPPNAALLAWSGYVVTFVVGYLVAPAALNVNFANRVWPPLAGVFPRLIVFQAAIVATALLVLAAGEWLMRRAFRRTAAQPATS